jgi:hypothetical protein
MNMQELISKATHGQLTQHELAAVVTSLDDDTEDTYTALLVIGRAGATQYRPVVERYLHSPNDPMLARLAVQILCSYWGLAVEYRDALERFVRKVTWDDEEDVRLMAISCMGYYLAQHQDRHWLTLLLTIFRNADEDQIIREAAYCSLAIAIGKSPLELPPASRHFDLEHDIDPTVLTVVEGIVATDSTL